MKTHCPYGHALVEGNIYVSSRGWRSCRTCSLERSKLKNRAKGLVREENSTLLIMPILNEETISRFWSNVDCRGSDECWEWKSCRSDTGYGYAALAGSRRVASRVALTIALGRDLRADEFACHHCDNPPCCNPKHLFAGTAKENTHDARAKGRLVKWSGRRRGSKNPCAKLSEDDVREIRRLRGMVSHVELSKRFGVSLGNISGIQTGKNWPHIHDQEAAERGDHG